MRESTLTCVLVRLYECVVLLTASADYLPYPTFRAGGRLETEHDPNQMTAAGRH